MEILGILIGVGLLIYFAYRGFSIYYLAPICGIVVAVFNKMSLTEVVKHLYMDGVVGFLLSMFIIIILGTILGALYGESGATISIAHGIKRGLMKEVKNEKTAQFLSIFIITGSVALLCYGGIDGLALMFAVFPLIASIMSENNIPRRYLPALLLCGAGTGIVALPGSPQLPNLIPAQILGSDPRGALIPGIIGWLIAYGSSMVYLHLSISKAKANGETFDYGDGEYMLNIKNGQTKEKTPHFLIALLPLVLIFSMFNIFKINIVFALSAGVVLSIALFWKQVSNGNPANVLKTINQGAHIAPTAAFSVGSVAGFGSIVAASSGFKTLLAIVTAIKGPALWVSALSVSIMTGIAGSSPGGLAVSVPVLGPIFVDQLGVNANAFHRIATFASCTIDSLPINGGIILMLFMAGLTHKEGYGPIARCTILFTTISTIVVVTLLYIFPAMA